MNTKTLTRGAIVCALYIALCYIFATLSFGMIQIRIANVLYGLCFLYPYLIVPLSIGSAMSNLLIGGLGLLDVVFGGISTFIVCYIISKLKHMWMIVPVIIIGVATLISSYLHFLLGVPFEVLFYYIILGQIIPATLSYFLTKKINAVIG